MAQEGFNVQSLRTLLRLAASALEQAITADDAVAVLSLLHAVLEPAAPITTQVVNGTPDSSADAQIAAQTSNRDLPSDRPVLRQMRLHCDSACVHTWQPQTTLAAVYWECFDHVLEICAAAVEAPWWPRLSPSQQSLLMDYVRHAPAPVLLTSVSWYLSTLAQQPTPTRQHSSSVDMAGGGMLRRVLAQRFVVDTPVTPATGLGECVRYCAAYSCPQLHAPLDLRALTLPPALQPLLMEHPSAVQHSRAAGISSAHVYAHMLAPERLAGPLVALPDRVPSLAHEHFYRTVLSQLLNCVSDALNASCHDAVSSHSPRSELTTDKGVQGGVAPAGHDEQGSGNSAGWDRAIAVAAAQLTSAVMARLCARGHTHVVAWALLQPLHNPGGFAGSNDQETCTGQRSGTDSNAADGALGTGTGMEGAPVLAQGLIPALAAGLLSDPNTCTKLVAELLTQHAAATGVHTGAPTWVAPPAAPATSAPPARGGVSPHAAARQLLHVLGGPAALGTQPELQWAVTEQLLAHRTLPSPVVLLLLDVLTCAGTPPALNPACTAAQPAHRVLREPAWWLQQLAGDTRDDTVPGQATSVTPDKARADAAAHASGAGEVAAGAPQGEGGVGAAVLRPPNEALDLAPPNLAEVAAGLALLWGDVAPLGLSRAPVTAPLHDTPAGLLGGVEGHAATARAGASLPGNGYLSCVLVALLQRLDKDALEGTPGLLPGLLRGVSHRLSSPTPAVRRQAMRVGRALSMVLDPANPLFDDQGPLDLLPVEMWPGAVPAPVTPPPFSTAHTHTTPGHQRAVTTARPAVSPHPTREHTAGAAPPTHGSDAREPDSDDETTDGLSGKSEGDSDDDSLASFDDVTEDPRADAWARVDPKDLQLRAVAASLRKTDDVTGVHAALGRLEPLVRAAPDELLVLAPELTRALLYCRVPEWAEPDPDTPPDATPAAQRALSLAAVLSTAPVPAGDTLLPEVFSPHVDTYQRLLALQSLAAAAQELSEPAGAPKLQWTPGQPPRLVYPQKEMGPASAAAPLPPPSSSPASQSSSHLRAAAPAVPPHPSSTGLQERSTRVWGHVTRRKRRAPVPVTHRNHFADVALRWTHGLLRQVDRVQHGVDLLGRDTLVLTCLLHTLGCFAECAAGTPVATGVGGAVMELLAAPQVHGHVEPAVRRAALLAAGQVLAALPPGRVAGLLRPAGGPGGVLAGLRASDPDAPLAPRLQWVQAWLGGVQEHDSDPTCRHMASACGQLYSTLAAQAAMEGLSLDSSGPWPDVLTPGVARVGLPARGGGGVGVGGVAAGPLGLVRNSGVLLPHHVLSQHRE